MHRRHLNRHFVLALVGAIIIAYQFCSLPSRTPTSGPFFKLSFSDSNLSTAQLSQIRLLTFCFSQIKFIPYIDLANPDPNAVTQTYDFDLEDFSYDPSGSSISFVSLPAGKYQSVQLKLSSQCSSGRSLQITNDNGIFSTTDAITLTFLSFSYLEITDSTTLVTLDLDGIIPGLLSVSGNVGIKPAAEASNGAF